MIIPKGVCYPEFYRAAQRSGIRIHSRYHGVSAWNGYKRNGIFWVAVSGNSRRSPHYLRKIFPFTEEGEQKAGEYLQKWREKHGLKTRKSKINREDPKILQRV